MDKPVLIIEMPELNNEAVVSVYHFLQELMNAFESHYFYQMQQYYRQVSPNNEIKNSF
jgi:hypothetical protein